MLKTHFQNQPTGLYRNNGKAEFEDVTAPAGLSAERRFISWGTAWSISTMMAIPTFLL